MPFAEAGDEPDTSGAGRRGAVERETPVTSGIDTRPQGNLEIPQQTYLPFFVALGLATMFVGVLLKGAVIAVMGIGLVVVAMLWWTWRTKEDLAPPEREPAPPVAEGAR